MANYGITDRSDAFEEIEACKAIINKGLERLETIFKANGGRGIELAEHIDRLNLAFYVLDGDRPCETCMNRLLRR